MNRGRTREVRLKAELPYYLTPGQEWIIATCDLLGVSSQGKTKNSAGNNLKSAIALFIKGCVAKNIFEQILSECGFSLRKRENNLVWTAEYKPKKQRKILRMELNRVLKIPSAHHKTPVIKDSIPDEEDLWIPHALLALRAKDATRARKGI